ncbi:hypothetical protein [Aquimarina brevivitae]|uniref:Uncharacterized protein n=1 Tax=Aquimarina brevivitae TaxID=323412 RepID=A0A4Q7P0S7_9FLAO|nr:hypothetical protein [Aquimarina brevivitae]RZS92252.1 hypothetical protein EV197_2888 [Aquimarina brevivitae]
MKKILLFLLIAAGFFDTFAQEIQSPASMITIPADRFWGVDPFDGIVYAKDNVLYKDWNTNRYQFTDFTLGELTYVSILNPLKILLFYGNANTVVFIDKYLNEINRIDFNQIPLITNAHLVSPANDNAIWVFDNNTQQLVLLNSRTKKLILKTQPIVGLPLYQYSNFNFCWLFTKEKVYTFNIYGSLVEERANENFDCLQLFDEQFYVLSENKIFIYSKDFKEKTALSLPEIKLKQFYVTDEILYIYDFPKLFGFELKSL